MSLYNMLFKVNPLAGYLMGQLQLDYTTLGRFRDAAIVEDGGTPPTYLIRVLTRTGGPNRADYQAQNDALVTHPLYVRDEDDAHDSTYALFYFRMPEGTIAEINSMAPIASVVDRMSIEDKFNAAIDAIKTGPGPTR